MNIEYYKSELKLKFIFEFFEKYILTLALRKISSRIVNGIINERTVEYWFKNF